MSPLMIFFLVMLAIGVVLWIFNPMMQDVLKKRQQDKEQADRDALLSEVKSLRQQVAGPNVAGYPSEPASPSVESQPTTPAAFTPEPPQEISGNTILTVVIVFLIVFVLVMILAG